MKTKLLAMMIILFASAVNMTAVNYDKRAADIKSKDVKHILVIGLNDNVQSNYFPNCMITEESGIPTDSIDAVYNREIAVNIAESVKDNNKLMFVPVTSYREWEKIESEIKIEGENEECYANLADVNKDSLEKLMEEADGDYLLILNRHYLKWQDQPLRTLFHFVSYSLYDREKNEITHGNN